MNVIVTGILYLIPVLIVSHMATASVDQPEAEDPLPTQAVEQTVEQPEPSPIVLETTEDQTDRERNKTIVEIYTTATFGEDQVPAMLAIVQKESGFNNKAQNKHSTAYGMYQFLDSTWKSYGTSKTSDPIQQTEAAMAYIKARYGTPQNALRFHQQNGYY